MATTQEIISAATALGRQIGTHDATRKFEAGVAKLRDDVDAQRALNDFNRHMNKLAEKEGAGQPIEVEDKRRLEQLQSTLIANEVVRTFQMGQMDYLDLMRKVDDAISRASLSDTVASAIEQTPGS